MDLKKFLKNAEDYYYRELVQQQLRKFSIKEIWKAVTFEISNFPG